MKPILMIVAACSLAACASTPVVYEAATELNSSGYMEMPVENGRQAVAYTGTKGMSREQVAQFALLRAAELTTAAGQEWFAVTDKKTQAVQLVKKQEDLKGRSGGIVTGESSGTATGGSGRSPSGGVSDGGTRGGPSTGGFGGGDVPYQVLERWTPPTVHQAIIVIQMGKGTQANLPGLDQTPEFYDAKAVAADIRAKMSK
jgi:hypothetical protein